MLLLNHSSRLQVPGFLTVITVMAVFLVFPGCPTGGSGDRGGSNGEADQTFTADPLSLETSAAISESCAEVELLLMSQGISQAMLAAVPILENHDCVNDVSWVEQPGRDPYLLVEFSNGMLFLMDIIRLTDIRPPVTGDQGIPASGSTEPLSSSLIQGIVQPHGTRAQFFDLPEFSTDTCLWMNLFEDAGYSWEYLPDWRVEDFRNLHQNAFTYVATHGSVFQHGDEEYFAFHIPSHMRCTDDDLSYIANGDFWDIAVILQRGIYIVENEDPFVSEDTRYMITNKYIEKYSSAFSDGSIFYADCCYSAEPNPYDEESIPLVNTLLGMNVGQVLGWNAQTGNRGSIRAANFLVGQMMGDLSGLDLLDEDFSGKPFKPYSLLDSFTALQHFFWNYSVPGELILFGNGGTILRPSIKHLHVNVDVEGGEDDELSLLGNFGDRSGMVMVSEVQDNPAAGTSLSWTDWQDDGIMATLDNETAGYITVVVDGVPSNAFPLSRWEITDLEVTGIHPGGIGPQLELTINASWRGEILDERDGILSDEGETFMEPAWSEPNPENSRTATEFSISSSCDYSFSGTFEDSRYRYEYPDGANQGSMPLSFNGMQNFLGTVTMRPDEGKALFNILLTREAFVLKTDKQSGATTADEIFVSVGLIFETGMDKDGNISSHEELSPYQFTLPDIEPEYPPLQETCR